MRRAKLPLVREAALRVGETGRVTVTRKLCVALNGGRPLSETATRTVWVDGDWAMAGRQVKRPLLVLMTAPVGALSRLKVRACAGTSGSVAELVSANTLPARMDWLPTGASSGVWSSTRGQPIA